jgi:hypothetical protein
MEKSMVLRRKIVGVLTFVTLAALCQAQARFAARGQDKPSAPAAHNAGANTPAEDISGMYSFLKEGEFIQLNVEKTAFSGYISRLGDSDSDRGVFLDQFFENASIQGHDVSFTTKPVHGVWFEFKGRYQRGAAKTKVEDGYYVLRGTLKEYSKEAGKNTVSRSREVEFKLLGQPDDSDEDGDGQGQKAKRQRLGAARAKPRAPFWEFAARLYPSGAFWGSGWMNWGIEPRACGKGNPYLGRTFPPSSTGKS